jgi:methyltransferase (TIGR00027 family)
MRAAEPSRTAAWVAVTRGLGALLPAEAQLIDDPYGLQFAGSGPAGRWARAAAERDARWLARLPGVQAWIIYMQVRTRVLDDAVRAFVARGGAQLVILGAGYDCRALRLAELANVRVFEVDHPATQGRKQRVLDRLGAASGARYLAWDFEARPMAELPAALAALGLDLARPTFTIWEGVTMYLREPALDASVRAIAAYSGPGSTLAMTYMTQARLARPTLATRATRALVGRVGEPWVWGWEPAALPAWLATRGFDRVDDVDLADASLALLPPQYAIATDGRRVALADREHIASAHRGPA